MKRGTCCLMRGLPAMTKWGVRPGFAGIWALAASNTSWASLRTRRSGIWKAKRLRMAVEIVKRRVVAKIERKIGPEETFVAIRTTDEEGAVKHDYYLSNASPDTPLEEFARVATAAHRIEECIKRGKSEAGMADYQVRTWRGWHHHITLSLIATWFLVGEARRGKKMDTSHHGSADPRTFSTDPAPGLWMRHSRSNQPRMRVPPQAQRACTILSPSST